MVGQWGNHEQMQSLQLQIAIPRHYRELVEDSIGLATNYTGVAPNYSPVEYYQGNSLNSIFSKRRATRKNNQKYKVCLFAH